MLVAQLTAQLPGPVDAAAAKAKGVDCVAVVEAVINISALEVAKQTWQLPCQVDV